jgi:hypothetical protein
MAMDHSPMDLTFQEFILILRIDERMGRDFVDPVLSMLVDLAIVPVECTGIISIHVLSALSRALATLIPNDDESVYPDLLGLNNASKIRRSYDKAKRDVNSLAKGMFYVLYQLDQQVMTYSCVSISTCFGRFGGSK